MGGILDKILISPSSLENEEGGVFKILFLMLVYGFILFKASNLISDGSELLLLIPSVAGIVGSVVLPILGAVPDGMIVLFSGLGDDAANQLSVGIGALAGSTIMLLTIPWFFSLLAGRVSLDSDGTGYYKKKEKLVAPKWSLLHTGTNVKPGLRYSAFMMIITSISYLLIQGPAFKYSGRTNEESDSSESDTVTSSEVQSEHWWALAGFISSLVLFIVYLVYQVKTANSESKKDKIAQVQHDAVCKSLMSVSAVFAEQLFSKEDHPDERSELMMQGTVKARFDSLLREFFNRHDLDGNGVVDATEMKGLLADLGEYPTKEEFDTLMNQMDANHDGTIQYSEFHDSMKSYIKHLYDKDNGLAQPFSVVVPDEGSTTTTTGETALAKRSVNATSSEMKNAADDEEVVEEEGEEEEEEEVPDDLTHLLIEPVKLPQVTLDGSTKTAEVDLERVVECKTLFGQKWDGNTPELTFTLDDSVKDAKIEKRSEVTTETTGDKREFDAFVTSVPGKYLVHVTAKDPSQYTKSIDDIEITVLEKKDSDSNTQQKPDATTEQKAGQNTEKKAEAKSNQKITVKKKTRTIKFNKLKKKKQTVAPLRVTGAKGKVTYKKVSVSKKKKGKKYTKNKKTTARFTVNKKTGKITVKKNTKKGTYKVKIKVSAAGDATHNAAKKTVTVVIKVK